MAIDGFGEVGSAVAKLAAAKGARVIAISNSRGSIHDGEGLDADALAKMRAEEGGEFIRRFGPAPSQDVFSAECDVFVPCARSLSVTEAIAARIRAPIIVAGANAPMLPSTERSLWKKGKTIVPDGVSNCGGVLLGWLKHFRKENDEERIGRRLRERVDEVLSCNEPPSDFLSAFCRRRLAELRAGKYAAGPDSLLPPLS
jgi:glutamate dehydrogenase/leucine dehydrogenase